MTDSTVPEDELGAAMGQCGSHDCECIELLNKEREELKRMLKERDYVVQHNFDTLKEIIKGIDDRVRFDDLIRLIKEKDFSGSHGTEQSIDNSKDRVRRYGHVNHSFAKETSSTRSADWLEMVESIEDNNTTGW